MTTSILFLGGPSGAGKSTAAGWAAEELGLLFLEVDQWETDGIEFHRLRPEWENFWIQHDAKPLADALLQKARAAGRHGAILSFPSHLLFTTEKIAAARTVGIETCILFGPASACRESFLARERQNGRGLGLDHWEQFNRVPHRIYGSDEYAAVRIDTFRDDGSPRPREEIVTRIRQQLRLSVPY